MIVIVLAIDATVLKRSFYKMGC